MEARLDQGLMRDLAESFGPRTILLWWTRFLLAFQAILLDCLVCFDRRFCLRITVVSIFSITRDLGSRTLTLSSFRVQVGAAPRIRNVRLPLPGGVLGCDIGKRYSRHLALWDLVLDEILFVDVLSRVQNRQPESLYDFSALKQPRLVPLRTGGIDDQDLDVRVPSRFIASAHVPGFAVVWGRGHEWAQITACPVQVLLQVNLEGKRVDLDLAEASSAKTVSILQMLGVNGPVLHIWN